MAEPSKNTFKTGQLIPAHAPEAIRYSGGHNAGSSHMPASESPWNMYLQRLSGSLTPLRAQQIRELWDVLARAIGAIQPPHAAISPTGEFSMTWDRGRHHFEIDVNEAGAYDWFYMDRDSDFRAGEEAIPVGSLSSHLIPYLLRTVQ